MPQDERIAKLSIPAELLFVRLISMADDEGRFRAAVNGIIGFAFPDREDVTQAKVKRWLREIEAQELIVVYEHDGVRYGVVRNFGRHQSIQKATWSRLPAPPDAEIVAANVPEALRDDPNSSPTNTREIREPVQDRSDPPHTDAHASASAQLPAPSSSSTRPKTEDQQRGGREHGKVDPLIVPTDMSPELAARVDPVLAILQRVQAERGGKMPTPRGVALKLLAYPGRDHVKVAHELRYWATAGAGLRRNPQDWHRQYGAFLEQAEDAAPSQGAGPRPLASNGRRDLDAERHERTARRLGHLMRPTVETEGGAVDAA
jgi:hypothetical protein